MDFKLSEQQTMIKNMVAEFAQRQLAPNALEIDEKAEFPKENIEQMKGLGITVTSPATEEFFPVARPRIWEDLAERLPDGRALLRRLERETGE